MNQPSQSPGHIYRRATHKNDVSRQLVIERYHVHLANSENHW